MKVLFVDACPRGRGVSRTLRLADAFLSELARLRPEAEVREMCLEKMGLVPLTGRTEAERSRRIDAGDTAGPAFECARAFAGADLIVVAAPYWDFMFPASLKVFIEHVCVRNVTFVYRDDRPVGLCRAQALVYLTTAGGIIGEEDWGARYLRGVTQGLLGVGPLCSVSAEGLDLTGADPEALTEAGARRARALAAEVSRMMKL